MILTIDELSELFSIIDYFHLFFIAENLGTDILSESDKKTLLSWGVDLSDFTKNDEDYLSYAFKFGMLASALKTKKAKTLDFIGLKSFIASGKFIPLTPAEKYALAYVKTQAYNDIKGLGNRIKKSTGEIIIESSRTRRLRAQAKIRKQAKIAIRDRKTVTELSSALGHATGDWTRDFDRIADYIMHDAYHQGIASQLLAQYGDGVEIFYTVYNKACKHCVEIYLTDGIESEPRVFKLKDVIANGSNIGRKSSELKATVSPIHPFCRCTMHHKPENTVWSEDKHMFVLKRNTYGVKRKSKIKVTITKS